MREKDQYDIGRIFGSMSQITGRSRDGLGIAQKERLLLFG